METIIAAIISSLTTLLGVYIATRRRSTRVKSDMSMLFKEKDVTKISISFNNDKKDVEYLTSEASEKKVLTINENNIKFEIEFGSKESLNIKNMTALKDYSELIARSLTCQ